MTTRTSIAVPVLLLALGVLAASPFGPQLDDVPGPIVAVSGLPAPATWPALRHERPLRLLVVSWKGQSVEPFRRIGRRLRALVEYRHVSTGGDEQYHVHDAWIEPHGSPTRDEIKEHSIRDAIAAVATVGGKPAYDVIICSGSPADILDNLEFQANLLAHVREGGTLVVCGPVYPKEPSPLASAWPVRPRQGNTWHSHGSRRTDSLSLAGVPTHKLTGHNWMPMSEPAADAQALSTGESGATFLRQLGRGNLIVIPTGAMSRLWNSVTVIGRKYDHDDIWLRLWDHLLYDTVRGAAAFPVVSDLGSGAKEAPAGKEYVLPARLVNRSKAARAARAALSVHVTDPRGRVLFVREETVDLVAMQKKSFDVRVPVGAEWGDGLYPVYLTVGDPAAQRQWHQSLEHIPVRGQLTLSLAPDRKGYRLGEDAVVTLSASSREPWQGELRFGVYDFRGRLLGVDRRQVSLTAKEQQLQFRYKFVDHGVRADSLWAQVSARQAGKEWGRAETKLYRQERWSPRNEYQWSTWAGIACGPPSTVPAGMRLMAHAGMNALGYPGRSELFYPAERWGWRYYNEGIGMNMFSPVIEYENEAEIQAALEKEARSAASPDLTSAAFVLGSVGEEAGFRHGWGTRYYWDKPVAPEKACAALRWFLKEKYPDLARLNAAWKTNYRSWDDVKLTGEFSGRNPNLDADGWARPKESPLGAGVTAVSLAPYADTAAFYDWYYDKIVNSARRILRERINPVTLAMSSAPTIGSAHYDVRQTGPGGWNESQWHSLMEGPEPGFGLVWGHFDWSVKTDNLFWGFLLTRSGHNNYWVDVPLMFNNDLTHTRASFAMRRWTSHFAARERLILDSKPAPADIAVLGANGLGGDLDRSNMAASVQIALAQAGFALPAINPDKLDAYKLVLAIGRQAVSKAEAERLQQYVLNGGTLVFTPRFASQTELGVVQPVSPGWNLAERWGFRVDKRTGKVPQNHAGITLPFRLDGVGPGFKGHRAVGLQIWRESVTYDDSAWKQLAEYDDHTPALLTRQLGKGRLVYLNSVYQSHHYIQFVTPTGPERQAFFKLVRWLATRAGATSTLNLDGELEQVLHAAVRQFTDPAGRIRYVVVRTVGEGPWVSGTLVWRGRQGAGYDVLAAAPGSPSPRANPVLNLRPGAGKLFAFLDEPVKSWHVEPATGKLTAGQPLRLTFSNLGESGKPVAGAFPLELRISVGNREIPGLRRSFSCESGGGITLQTALNDPPGDWTATVTEALTGLSATARLEVRAPSEVASEPGFTAWGWPSEFDEPTRVGDGEFVRRLRALAELYRREPPAPPPPEKGRKEKVSPETWMIKQRLGYYYDFFPGTRHELLRPLLDVDWRAHIPALQKAVEQGETFILTGEDLGIHPGNGLTTYPHHDGHQVAALAQLLAGGKWARATADGDTLAVSLGKGKVILCRESIDAAGNDNPSIARWQRRWLDELKREPRPSAALSENQLRQWWTGQVRSPSDRPRQVTWFDGNSREVKLAVDAKRPLGEVFAFVVPPTGKIRELSFAVSARGKGTVRFDVGCDNRPDGELLDLPGTPTPADKATTVRWSAAAQAVLDQNPYRDDNGWRIIPVRVTASERIELVLESLRVVMD
jgi:hypothetical protein